MMPKQTKKDKKKAWTAFARYIKARDALETTNCLETVRCYTCDRVFPVKGMHAGHGVSGRTNAVLFDEEIVKAQCYGCNVGRGGAYEYFIPKLMNEHSKEWYEEKACNSKRPVKLDYRSLEAEYKEKLEELIETHEAFRRR